MLQCRSNALTRANNFLLFLNEIKIWVLFRTDCCKTDSGPWETSYSSNSFNCASDMSDLFML